MAYFTSFHSKFGQYLVELELEGLAKRNPRLGLDSHQNDITWDMLVDLKTDESSTFFPAPYHLPSTIIDFPRPPSPLSKGLPVAIVGGGVAGLRIAMMLEYLDIPYELFEVGGRYGGRVFAYHFKTEEPEDPTTQNYFDVGATRFPDNAVNASLFELFKELDITDEGGAGGKLLPYHLQSPSNILLFNRIRKSAGEVNQNPGADHFNDGKNNGGLVPEEYIQKTYQKPNGTIYHGVDACLEAAYGPFKEALARNWTIGWALLMTQDHRSTRSYMLDVMNYPWSVVQWMERSDSGTAGFDHMGFTESVLESLEFDYPTGIQDDSKVEDIQWRCVEGGAETLTKAMYASLKNTAGIQTRKRVTSIAKIKLPLPVDCPGKLPAEIKVADHTVKWPVEIERIGGITVMAVTAEDATSEFPPESFVPNTYSHAVSTVPFACLRAIDLSECGLDYKQEMALRSLHYSPAVKVGMKFRTRWWQESDPSKAGGQSKTDRQSRVVMYPDYGLDGAKDTPGVLTATYNWKQDAFRYGSLIEAKDWSKVLDPDREHPAVEKHLLNQVFADLAQLHGRHPSWYREQMIDYYAYDWYHNPFTMGAYASFGPGQFSNLYPSISKPASDGYLHFGGEVASYHHGWVAGALDSAWRCVYEILAKDGTEAQKKKFEEKYGKRKEFTNMDTAAKQYYRGVYANSLEKPGGNDGPFEL